MTPKFKLGQDFCTMHLPPKSHHLVFTYLEVIVLTNKHTNKKMPPKTSSALRYGTTLGNCRTEWATDSMNWRNL